MRWDELFDDLEGQLERELSAEEQELVVEEERLRLGRLGVRDRLRALRAAGDEPLAVTLRTGSRVSVIIDAFGRDWASGEVVDGPVRRGRCVLPLSAIAAVTVSPRRVSSSLDSGADARAEASLALRLGLPFVLRDLCRRRRAVDLATEAGLLRGTIDRVGRDHVDLAVHEPGSARRAGEVTEVALVPLASVVLVVF